MVYNHKSKRINSVPKSVYFLFFICLSSAMTCFLSLSLTLPAIFLFRYMVHSCRSAFAESVGQGVFDATSFVAYQQVNRAAFSVMEGLRT